VDDLVGIVLGQDDRCTCAQRFANLLLQLGEVWSIPPQNVSRMRTIQFDAEHAFIDRSNPNDSRDMRNEQSRDRRRCGIDFEVDRETMFAESIQNLSETRGARIRGVQAHTASALQFDREAAVGAQHFCRRSIERRLDAHGGRDDGVGVRHSNTRKLD
jgi:hypothetical protein